MLDAVCYSSACRVFFCHVWSKEVHPLSHAVGFESVWEPPLDTLTRLVGHPEEGDALVTWAELAMDLCRSGEDP